MTLYKKIEAACQLVAGSLGRTAVRSWDDWRLLGDFTQINRRTRRAYRTHRGARATYLFLNHQQRRIARRREIRALVGE